jgi:extracellular factor (EF) 3-hydroxypalmitic acid methyl ester biosynthesis protein
MSKWAELLVALTNDQSNRIFEAGREKKVLAGDVLVREREPLDTMYFVLEGLLHVKILAEGDDIPLARLGTGEIVGEMSFLDPHPASASVVAAEDSLVLTLAHATLAELLDADAEMAARFYRSLAVVETRRLRRTLGHLEQSSAARGGADSQDNAIQHRINEFKDAVLDYEKAEKTGADTVDEIEANIRGRFADLVEQFDQLAGARSTLPEAARVALGQQVQREMLPYLLMTTNAARWYTKPRGYAGDFYSIEKIYQDQAEGSGAVGALLDRCFLDMPAAIAVKNRRHVLTTEIKRTVAATPDRPVRLTSMACGPAREVFDSFRAIDDPRRLDVTLIDMDIKALSFVEDQIPDRNVRRQLKFAPENLIYLALGRRELDLVDQDLVYSIGLVDYFSDALVIKLLDYIYRTLRPGGRVILGNFHPDNTTRAVMDHVLEWRLIHRSEADMDRLFEASAFGRPSTRILWEEQRINLFAECVREA